MLITARGRIQPNIYEKANGEKVYAIDLIADHIEFLESRQTVEQRTARDAAWENDDEEWG